MQLPPVCELGSKELADYITEDGEDRFDYLWDLSALYVDHFFDEDLSVLKRMYLESGEPNFVRMAPTLFYDGDLCEGVPHGVGTLIDATLAEDPAALDGFDVDDYFTQEYPYYSDQEEFMADYGLLDRTEFETYLTWEYLIY